MDTDAKEQLLLEVVDYYQDGIEFANLSGQQKEWYEDHLSLSIESIGALVDALGKKLADDIFAHIGRENYNISEDDIEEWVQKHIGEHTTVEGWTAVGQQVAAHCFSIGLLFGKRYAEESQRGRAVAE